MSTESNSNLSKKKSNQASGLADADYCQTDVRNRQKWADALNWRRYYEF